MSEEQDKIDVKGTEEEKGAQETASDKVDKSGEGSAWYSKPGEMGNKAGDTIQGTLGYVGEPLGKGLEYGTKPVGNVVDSLVGGLMRSGQVLNEAPEHGKSIEGSMREKVGGWVGQGQEALHSGQAQEYMKKAQDAVEGQGGNAEEYMNKAKEMAGQAGEGAQEGGQQAAEGAKETAGQAGEGAEQAASQASEGGQQAAQKTKETAGKTGESAKEGTEKASQGGQEAAQKTKDTAGQGAEGGQKAGQEALQQSQDTLNQSEKKLGDLTGSKGGKQEE